MTVGAPATLSVLALGEGAGVVESAVTQATTDDPVEPTVEAVEGLDAALAALDAQPWDCVVASTTDGDDVSTTVADLRAAVPEHPIVWVAEDAASAAAAVAAGATDSLLRAVFDERPSVLGDRIRGAVSASDAVQVGGRQLCETLLEHSNDGLLLLDAAGTVTYQSPSFARILDYDRDSLLGADVFEYVHPDDLDAVLDAFDRVLGTDAGVTEEIQHRFRDGEGEWRWLESVGSIPPDGDLEGGVIVNTRLITERKENERQLERYETLLTLLPDTIAITDLDGVHQEIYGFEGWSGYDREELLGEPVTKMTPPESVAIAEDHIIDLILDEETDKAIFEFELESKAGERIPFENHVTALPPDDDGRIPGIMNVLRDISERTERERDLELAETVFQNVQDGVFLIDVTAEGQFVLERANPAFRRTLGLTEADVAGASVRELAGPDLGADIAARLQQCVEDGTPIEYEDAVDIDGETRHFHNRVAPVVDDGQVDRIVGVTRDVTERMRRQAELERKNRAMDEAPIGITIAEATDAGLEIVYANDGFEALTGYSEADAAGGGWSILHGEETDPSTTATLREALEAEEAISTEVTIYRKDGAPRWFQVNLSPVSDEDGTVTHYVGFQQDITELKEYETEIERRFDEFADLFAEDLREPIERARAALDRAGADGDGEALADAVEWLDRADDLLADLATVHSFTVPSRDHSESALTGALDDA